MTTHDLVWINSSITGVINPYSYVTLEAAMAGQYSYGDSHNVPAQAANLLDRLLCTHPFAAGNVRTAFIATLSFLNANGYATTVDDGSAAAIVSAVVDGGKSAQEAIADSRAGGGAARLDDHAAQADHTRGEPSPGCAEAPGEDRLSGGPWTNCRLGW